MKSAFDNAVDLESDVNDLYNLTRLLAIAAEQLIESQPDIHGQLLPILPPDRDALMFAVWEVRTLAMRVKVGFYASSDGKAVVAGVEPSRRPSRRP